MAVSTLVTISIVITFILSFLVVAAATRSIQGILLYMILPVPLAVANFCIVTVITFALYKCTPYVGFIWILFGIGVFQAERVILNGTSRLCGTGNDPVSVMFTYYTILYMINFMLADI